MSIITRGVLRFSRWCEAAALVRYALPAWQRSRCCTARYVCQGTVATTQAAVCHSHSVAAEVAALSSLNTQISERMS